MCRCGVGWWERTVARPIPPATPLYGSAQCIRGHAPGSDVFCGSPCTHHQRHLAKCSTSTSLGCDTGNKAFLMPCVLKSSGRRASPSD